MIFIYRYAKKTNETHEQMRKLLDSYFAIKEKNQKDYLISQKQREKLKPIYRTKLGSEKNKVCS